MKVEIRVIPHREQRYETTGDWFLNDARDQLLIRVSRLGDWRYELAVAVHELIEALLCINSGVSCESVDAFDREFEAARAETLKQNFTSHVFTFNGELLSIDAEPGDHPAAPYHRQHGFATAVERMLIAALGRSWAAYDKATRNVDGTADRT